MCVCVDKFVKVRMWVKIYETCSVFETGKFLQKLCTFWKGRTSSAKTNKLTT